MLVASLSAEPYMIAGNDLETIPHRLFQRNLRRGYRRVGFSGTLLFRKMERHPPIEDKGLRKREASPTVAGLVDDEVDCRI